MSAAAASPRPLPLYLAECRFGRFGNAFRETDRDRNSRDEIISLIRSGEIDIIKVIEIDEAEGRCRDVTDEIVTEADDLIEQRRAA
jgi:hypothetical protein